MLRLFYNRDAKILTTVHGGKHADPVVITFFPYMNFSGWRTGQNINRGVDIFEWTWDHCDYNYMMQSYWRNHS
jgi:hypothetical protein